jgi:hypothetical protein
MDRVRVAFHMNTGRLRAMALRCDADPSMAGGGGADGRAFRGSGDPAEAMDNEGTTVSPEIKITLRRIRLHQ